MRTIKKGSTDQSVVIRIIDSTAFTPETAVEHNTSGIALWYRREGATTTAITEAALTALDDAHSDGGIEHIGDGYYRLDLPDAAFATGVNGVLVGGTVTGMIVIGCYVHLVDYDPQNAVRMGMTALPNAAADAAGGLPISDAGGLDLDAKVGALTFTVANKVDANAVALSGDTGAADNAESFFDGTGYAGTNNVIPTVTTLTNLPAITANWLTATGINAGAITNAKFAAGAIDATAIADTAIRAAKFDTAAITASVLAANSITANAIAADAIHATAIAGDAINAASIKAGAIDIATFASDCLTGGFLKANVESITAGAITAAAIANGAIDNATFAADVGSTAGATNIIALAVDKSLELLKVPKSDSTVSWNATALAAINAEVDTALNTAIPGSPTANSINERVATMDGLVLGTIQAGTHVAQSGDSYALANGATGFVAIDTVVDAIKVVTDKLATTMVLDGAVYDFTAAALAAAPTGGSAPTVEQIRAEIDSNSTQLAAILLDTGTTLDTKINTISTAVVTSIPATLVTISGYVDCLPVSWVVPGVGTSTLTSGDVATALTTALTTTTMAEDYPADGAAATPAELLYLILSCVSQFDITTTSLVTRKLDGTTQAAAYTLDDATSPTSRVRSA